MIIRAYIKVVEREDIERAEIIGDNYVIDNTQEELIAIRADCIESMKRNRLTDTDGNSVECTDVYMQSGDSFLLMAPYNRVYNAWVAMLENPLLLPTEIINSTDVWD